MSTAKVNLKAKGSRRERSIVSRETETYYYKKGDTVVISSQVPIIFEDHSGDRVYKYEKIDHGLSHDLQEFKAHKNHPIEWVVTINALHNLKIIIDKDFTLRTLKLRVIYLLDNCTQC